MWRAGDQVDAFRIEGLAPSSGGRGLAFRATRAGQSVFLKLFLSPRKPQLGSPALIARKQEEAERFFDHQVRLYQEIAAAQLEAASLCRHVAFLRTPKPHEGGFAVASEWLDLIEPERLRSGVLGDDDLGARRALLAGLAEGVAALHARAIVHGDIKLDNVGMAARNGGHIAKLFDYDHGYFFGAPRRGDFVFDPIYAAPETLAYAHGAQDSAKDLDGAADVFAFSLVAAEILLKTHCDQDGARTHALLSEAGVGPRLIEAICRGLERDKRRRPSMAEFCAALREVSTAPHAATTQTALETPGMASRPAQQQTDSALLEEAQLRRPRLILD